MRRAMPESAIIPRRLRWVVAVGAVAVVWIVLALLGARESVDLVLVLLPLMLAAMVVGAVAGTLPGITTSVCFVLLVNWYLIAPVHTFRIESGESLTALILFVLGAIVASIAMNAVISAREQAAITIAQRRLIADVVDELSPRDALERLRVALELDSVTMERTDATGHAELVLASPDLHARSASAPVLDVTVLDAYRIRGYGPARMAMDRSFLDSLSVAVARAYEGELLLEQQENNARLIDLDRARSALLASVGHDLRTPLSAVLVAADSLRLSDAQLTSDDRRALLDTIDSSGRRLDSLIENLLDMSRIESGALISVPRPTMLDAVVARAVVEVSSDRVVLHAPEEVLVMCDEALLGRAVVNVVSNAVRHDGSTREIAVEVLGSDDSWLIRVTDHGRGIPIDEREEALRPFGHVGARADGGAGAGLSIAEAFMVAMGGALILDETAGGGLTVTLSLPRKVAP